MISDETDVLILARSLNRLRDQLTSGRVTHVKMPNVISPTAELYVNRIDAMLGELAEMKFEEETA